MILYAVGLIVVLIAAIALYAFHIERRTRSAQWSMLLLIAGIIITTIGFWTQRDNPSNTFIMTWTITITGVVLALIAATSRILGDVSIRQ